jgi:NitT/TauT family transport system permease protein
MKKQFMTLLNACLVLASLLLLWRLSIWIFAIPKFMLPTPWGVAKATISRGGSLLTSVWITGESAVCGLLASVVAGILIALVFAQSRWIRRMFYPYTILLQTVPIIAIAPLILMWVGPGILAVMTIAFIICLPAIIANTTQGLISVERNMLDLFLMHNAKPAEVLWKLRLPHAVPSLFTGLRIASGVSVIGAIIGELFAGSTRVGEGGLGYAIQYASSQLETDYLFALVFAASALGFAFFFIIMFLEWYFLHNWHESASPAENE